MDLINHVKIVGTAVTEPVFSHCCHTEKFFTFKLQSKRLSNASDTINVIISEVFFPINSFKGEKFEIEGEIRTFSKKRHLQVFLFADGIHKSDSDDQNQLNMIGTLCKNPIYRVTPNGKEIAELLVSVARRNKNYTVPCICWGRAAKKAGTLKAGDVVKIDGRFQSRDYVKKISNTEVTKTTYEVSCSTIEMYRADDYVDA